MVLFVDEEKIFEEDFAGLVGPDIRTCGRPRILAFFARCTSRSARASFMTCSCGTRGFVLLRARATRSHRARSKASASSAVSCSCRYGSSRVPTSITFNSSLPDGIPFSSARSRRVPALSGQLRVAADRVCESLNASLRSADGLHIVTTTSECFDAIGLIACEWRVVLGAAGVE